jgi:L-2-hydroxyglutarate oxidase
MNYSKTYQVAIIGGGIIGASTALNLLKIKNISLIVLEAEEKLSAHQTGNNSGVIHSGIYYKPGTLKALNCSSPAATASLSIGKMIAEKVINRIGRI